MKILHVQKIAGLAGSERYLLTLLPELVKQGLDCYFTAIYLASNESSILPILNDLERSNVRVFRIRLQKDFIVNSALKLSKLIDEVKPDIVHAHLLHADLWGAFSKKLCKHKFKLVSTKHGYEERYINQYGLQSIKKLRSLYYYCANFAEKFIDKSFAVSKGIADLFIRLGISKKEKITVIHHGMDYSPIGDNANFRLSEYQILVPGRLVPFKGQRFIIEALPKIIAEFPEARLVLAGSGESEFVLKKMVNELGLDQNVTFLGFTNEIAEYMKNSNVIVIPSVGEGFGLVLLEAFNSCTPVVCFDVPACNEIVTHNVSGLLVEPFDTDKLGNSVIKIFANPEFGEQLAKEAKNKGENYFSKQRMVDETINFYQDL